MDTLVKQNPGITRSKPMEVDSQEAEVTPGAAYLPMDTQPDSSTGTFHLDITDPDYHPTLCNTQDPSSSSVTAQEDKLLDQLESPAREESRAPGGGRPKGSLASSAGMTLWKRKTKDTE